MVYQTHNIENDTRYIRHQKSAVGWFKKLKKAEKKLKKIRRIKEKDFRLYKQKYKDEKKDLLKKKVIYSNFLEKNENKLIEFQLKDLDYREENRRKLLLLRECKKRNFVNGANSLSDEAWDEIFPKTGYQDVDAAKRGLANVIRCFEHLKSGKVKNSLLTQEALDLCEHLLSKKLCYKRKDRSHANQNKIDDQPCNIQATKSDTRADVSKNKIEKRQKVNPTSSKRATPPKSPDYDVGAEKFDFNFNDNINQNVRRHVERLFDLISVSTNKLSNTEFERYLNEIRNLSISFCERYELKQFNQDVYSDKNTFI